MFQGCQTREMGPQTLEHPNAQPWCYCSLCWTEQQNNKQGHEQTNLNTQSWAVNKQVAWSGGAATVTTKDPFLLSMDQNLVTWVHQWWQSCIRRTIMHQKTKNTLQNGANISFDAPPWAARANFCPKPHNFTKNGQKNTAEHSNNTRTTLSTNEQRTTFRLAMNTHLTFSLGMNVRMLYIVGD